MPFMAQPSGDVIVVKVHATRLDAYLAPEFKAKLVHLVQSGHERIVMDMAALALVQCDGMAKCRRLAGKPSTCGLVIIDSLHPQMRSMTWNRYRSSAQHATLLSCNLIRRIPPSIMVAVSFINVRTVLPTFLRQKRLSWQDLKTPVSVIP